MYVSSKLEKHVYIIHMDLENKTIVLLTVSYSELFPLMIMQRGRRETINP